MTRFFQAILVVLIGLVGPADAQSKNPYGVAVRVNDRVITNFEIDQRVLLLRAFGTTGDLRKTATEQLVDDRLRLEAAKMAGIAVTSAEIEEGVSEFASRANITGDQLYQYIAQRGAARESMQAFVEAGLLWRNVVQARFGPRSAVSEDEIETTLSLRSGRQQQAVLISEIRLPLNQRGDEQTLEFAENLSRTIKSEAAFGAAARRYSKAPSRGRSGRLDWLPLSQLPAALAGQILALEPGEVTAPITLGPTVGLFQLRGVRDQPNKDAGPVSVVYVQAQVPPQGSADRTAAAAKKLRDDVDTCADLRAQSKRFANPGHTDHTAETGSLSAQVALELAQLDRHETGVYQAANGALMVIMLCSRLAELPEGTRENIRSALFNQRIGGFGQGYLQELKGDAVIVYK